jgi:hypothetical protein
VLISAPDPKALLKDIGAHIGATGARKEEGVYSLPTPYTLHPRSYILNPKPTPYILNPTTLHLISYTLNLNPKP